MSEGSVPGSVSVRATVASWIRRWRPRPPALKIDPQGLKGDLLERDLSEQDLSERAPSAPACPVDMQPMDVIIPVYGAPQSVERCLDSVFRYTDLSRHRLVVVVDGDPNFDSDQLRTGDREAAEVLVLEQAVNRGFVASVNHGMAASDRDVVLLNSDTVVTRHWLDKLQRAACSSPLIASVTPFSNHATICSLPQPLEYNALPTGCDVDTLAALVENAAVPEYPRLPTGVGMCLYLKRSALESVGEFDQASFGAGYGEETDWCLRALKAGWQHVLDDATFIFHEGEKSFGGRRERRIRLAERALERKHPDYVPTIARFLEDDPLEPVRRRVTTALARRALASKPAVGGSRRLSTRSQRVLHVVHGWPPFSCGGTENYAYWLAQHQQVDRSVAVYARIEDRERPLGAITELLDGATRVRLRVNNFTQRHPLSRNALHDRHLARDFDRFLEAVQPDLVHVHHLAGHALTLTRQVIRRGLPMVYQVQDWWALCARANRWRPDETLCPGPSPRRCSACLPLTGLPPAALWNRGLYRYRDHLARQCLGRADALVMGSRAIEHDYRAAGLVAAGVSVHVLPYGVELPEVERVRAASSLPLRFGVIGALMPHKGTHIAVEAFDGVVPERGQLDVWGDPEAAPEYVGQLRQTASPAVRFHGRFAEDDKDTLFDRLDVLLVPSLGLESYGLVAREAMARGVPVIASRRGALKELFGDGDSAEPAGGALFEAGNVPALRALIHTLLETPDTVAEWRAALPRVVGLDEHAQAIDAVYASVMEQRASNGQTGPPTDKTVLQQANTPSSKNSEASHRDEV